MNDSLFNKMKVVTMAQPFGLQTSLILHQHGLSSLLANILLIHLCNGIFKSLSIFNLISLWHSFSNFFCKDTTKQSHHKIKNLILHKKLDIPLDYISISLKLKSANLVFGYFKSMLVMVSVVSIVFCMPPHFPYCIWQNRGFHLFKIREIYLIIGSTKYNNL